METRFALRKWLARASLIVGLLSGLSPLAALAESRQIADPAEPILLIADFNAFEVNDGQARFDLPRGVGTLRRLRTTLERRMDNSKASRDECLRPTAAADALPVVNVEVCSAEAAAKKGGRTLFVARFAGCDGGVDEALGARVPNRVLGSKLPVEVWTSGLPTERGRLGGVDWAENGRVLFGSLASPLAGNLAGETEGHFAALLDVAEARGFPHLLRVWNFLPGINASENGEERYRLFNAGRAAAFDGRYGAVGAEARFSASSAVGSSGNHLVTWFAAAKSPGQHFGNPRQVHAYRYPADYGPRPPSFTRATLSPPELGQVLFLSGTASIAGHETRHVGELLMQLEETLHNIETLLQASPEGAPKLPDLPEFDLVRVYLRVAADLELVHEPLRRRIGPRPALHFVEADICRADLLLEIEGVAGLSG